MLSVAVINAPASTVMPLPSVAVVASRPLGVVLIEKLVPADEPIPLLMKYASRCNRVWLSAPMSRSEATSEPTVTLLVPVNVMPLRLTR